MARNVNAELENLNYQKCFNSKFAKMKHPFVKCPECSKLIKHDHNLIQRHFLEVHKIDDHQNKRSKGWRFVPNKGRVDNPLDLSRIIG